jgi:hypothetical protein
MIKRIFFFLWAIAAFLKTEGQVTDTAVPQRPALRISLLTCGPGDEVYETFGHTALRVIDSNVQGPLSDLVYNYGMFGYDDDFELKFMRGKLLYYVAANLYEDFVEEYTEHGRKVEEQVLLLDEAKMEEIKTFLEVNTLPENRYYKYDFFFDNCATRIRDIFPKSLGKSFAYSSVLPAGYQPTFRDIINQYFYRKHWDRLGVNILLGSKIDVVMTNMDIMFLPDYLRDGVAAATVNGTKMARPAVVLLPGNAKQPAGLNEGMALTVGLLLLTILGLTVKKLRMLGNVMSRLLLFVSGLLGCLMLVMWFATDHQGCSNNFNVLWALPLNVIVAFMSFRRKDKYAVVAMLLILVSLLLHVLKIQALIPELLPVLLALLLIYGYIYRYNQVKKIPAND